MVAHNRIVINGSSPGGEVWSINPRFFAANTDVVDEYADLLTWAGLIGAGSGGLAIPTDLKAALSAAGAVTSIRAEYIQADGSLGQAAEYVFGTPTAGTGTPTKPQTVAICFSLLTGRPGRSYRGRLYWPGWGAVMDGSTMRIPSVNRGNYVNALAGWLKAIGLAAPSTAPQRLVVVSQTLSTLNFVTQMGVGDVFDTQRRRRDSLVEQRTTIAMP